ncbi:MAG: class I SAM-dependent methyltransferase, partial [Chitinophagaceae bacterium]|nr:class I SAM-dependent methyltransferase [Chitinophagaceae bacterium]
LVQANQARFGNGHRHFIHHDLIQQVPGAFDLVFCRDCLVHFSFKDIFASLKNLRASKSAYLMTTTFTGQEVNADIPTGGWRPLNFGQAPFHFPKPVVIFEEKCTEGDGLFRDKSLAMWRLSDLKI